MTAQLTYGQTPAVAFPGMIAENFSQRQVDSYLAEGDINFGVPLVQGTALNQAEQPAAVAMVATLVFSAALITSNSTAIILNGVAIPGSPVVYAESNAATLTAIAAALQAEDEVASAVSDGTDTITITGANLGDRFTVAAVVTLGDTQATVAFAETSSSDAGTFVGVSLFSSANEKAISTGVAKYLDKEVAPVMHRGRVWVLAGKAIDKGEQVYPLFGDDLGKFTDVATANILPNAVARSSATTDGDLLLIELLGPASL